MLGLTRIIRLYAIILLIIAKINSQIHINQIGYEQFAPKTAVYETYSQPVSTTFNIINTAGITKYTGSASTGKNVWNNTGTFYVLDFSDFTDTGTFCIQFNGEKSEYFKIDKNILFKTTSYSIVNFFTQMRSKQDDTEVPLFGTPNITIDIHGGWRDATGDPGKHFSHLSYANYFNPQQTPAVVYALLNTIVRNNKEFSDEYVLRSEAVYGLDYLMRSLSDEGYFYISVFDQWGFGERFVCNWSGLEGEPDANYQCGMREGAGIAIAALAKGYSLNLSGDFSSYQYLSAAEKAYSHLKTYNTQYIDNHKENIIDLYCRLFAALELYSATQKMQYKNDADSAAYAIVSLIDNTGLFVTDLTSKRAFYHAVDEGMPIIALAKYLKEIDKNSIISDALNKVINTYLSISTNESNPFLYVKMRNNSVNQSINLAQGKTAEASSYESEDYMPQFAIDGNYDSRWASNYTDNEWLLIDLENIYNNISEIVIIWEDAYAKEYKVEYSIDKQNWTLIKHITNGQGGTKTFVLQNPVTARYIKITGIKRATEWGYSIYEVEINQNNTENSISFFMPHKNETGYWWQGENSRLASLSAAFLYAYSAIDSAFKIENNDITKLAISQLDWICGKNPFDICMIKGFGYKNYPDYPAEFGIPAVDGGICNGITSDTITEKDIYFNDDPEDTLNAWRFTEQWLPHNAWFLTAISIFDSLVNNPPIVYIQKQKIISLNSMIKIINNKQYLKLIFYDKPQNIKISLYTLNGKIIKTYDPKNDNIIINLNNIAKGIYFLNMKNNNYNFIHKIIIK